MFHAAPTCAASWPSVPAPNGVRPMRFSWRIRSLTMRVSSIFRYMLLTSSRLSPSVSCRARAVTVILAMVSRTSGATVRSALVHRVTKRVRGRVGAADPTRHALAGEPLRQTTRGRDRRGARALRHEMSFYQQQPHRGIELVVAHEHEVIEQDREHPLRQLERGARREA